MQNLQIFPEKHVKYIFDLKGSEVGRFTKNNKDNTNLTILKDINFKIQSELDDNVNYFFI